MRARATMVFTGTLKPDLFRAFVEHRARRLDLELRVAEVGGTLARLAVAGEPDLIDAFEMACSLGPLDCLVLDVIRQDHPAGAGEGGR